jgi:hypothetical protein
MNDFRQPLRERANSAGAAAREEILGEVHANNTSARLYWMLVNFSRMRTKRARQ